MNIIAKHLILHILLQVNINIVVGDHVKFSL